MSPDRICSRGHDVTGRNKIVKPNGYTECRECQRIAQQHCREKQKQRKAWNASAAS